ncbi:lantibiotic dehydratase [Streptomyces sp. MNP-20]|uniref:lantibiotic dehydratase n=1 Tax=Streptomyces sp. MNP-20 TaxID=2721165 RepID=UPI001556A64B|nr:lantibiotic dehydratase [Streptomyces sp. MNP-20]
MTRARLLQRGDTLLLRAAVLPFGSEPTWWPSLEVPDDCRRWLKLVMDNPAFADGLRAASPRLARAVERALSDDEVPPRRMRKTVVATARYWLRATGRPTPFGLFAGVAVARCGPATARIGSGHQPVARVDTLWLDHIRRDLQQRRDVLPHLTLQVNDLTARRGASLERPLPGGRRACARLTRPLSAVLDKAARPVPCRDLIDHLLTLGGTPQQALRLLREALEAGFLTSQLSAPMTDPDPLGHILDTLQPLAPLLEPGTVTLLDDLGRVRRLLADHARVRRLAESAGLRHTAEQRMSAIADQGRARLSVDLRLDATVQIPAAVLEEAERAADALLRLTRHAGEKPVWAAYHAQFWERYGAGSLVPIRDAVDLAAGAGFPADFPGSLWPEPAAAVLPRDRMLMAKAWHAAVRGEREVRITDEDLDALCTSQEDAVMAPHVEMGVRIHAATGSALERGEFTVAVRPAWSTGTLTGRFAATLTGSGLGGAYAKLPTLVEGALPAQLSFEPAHAHAENVARTPAFLPHVIPIGEHRTPAAHLIPVDDLAVLSTSKRLHLISLSRRRVIEPVVLHPLALEKQAPPLARFIALLGRGFATAWTQFDWGPLATAVPYLPRVRYRKAILAPARWHLTAAELPTGPFQHSWHQALSAWASTWRCPQYLDLRDDDRTLRLYWNEPLHARLLHAHLQRHGHAELAEAPDEQGLGWIGHAHEIALSLTSTQPPLPHPHVANAPVVTNQALPGPGDPRQPWVQAKIFTHPSAMDQILTRQLPVLLDELDGPHCWFVRYRTAQEEDHLRIRIAAAGADEHTKTTRALTRWAARLQGDALASRLVFDGYRPEPGRYGTGPALHAAERVFTSDSDTVRHALTDLASLDKAVLCALGMIDIARGLLGGTQGTQWMATIAARRTGVPTVTRQTIAYAAPEALDQHPGWTPRLDDARHRRRTALSAYRSHLADEQVDGVLESLLHMHHNRVMGPDREAEAACRHAARQACRSLLARAATQ